jgi:cell division protein FtsQ
LPLPAAEREPAEAGRWLPSGRSLLIGFLIAALAGGAYLIARESSVFAVRQVRVEGAPPEVASSIRAALSAELGSSLVSFNREAAERRLTAIPAIAFASFDRAFPHTLKVTVRLEPAVAVLRQGSSAWLVSSGARVLAALTARPYPPLPRIWLPKSVRLTVGGTLAGQVAGPVKAAGTLTGSPLADRVASLESVQDGIVLVLSSGEEVRLGDLRNLRVKLAIAARILRLAPGSAYVDVSVPERTVAGYNPQVGG